MPYQDLYIGQVVVNYLFSIAVLLRYCKIVTFRASRLNSVLRYIIMRKLLSLRLLGLLFRSFKYIIIEFEGLYSSLRASRHWANIKIGVIPVPKPVGKLTLKKLWLQALGKTL